jgi:hypothetical protein
MLAALRHCHHHDGAPATVTITAHKENGTMSDTYNLGETIYLNATVDNAESAALTGVAGTWTSTAGTISPNPNNPDEATLVNAPVGDVTVTFATASGVTGTYTATVVDSTPASVTITGSTTPPADETTAPAATDTTAA